MTRLRPIKPEDLRVGVDIYWFYGPGDNGDMGIGHVRVTEVSASGKSFKAKYLTWDTKEWAEWNSCSWFQLRHLNDDAYVVDSDA